MTDQGDNVVANDDDVKDGDEVKKKMGEEGVEIESDPEVIVPEEDEDEEEETVEPAGDSE